MNGEKPEIPEDDVTELRRLLDVLSIGMSNLHAFVSERLTTEGNLFRDVLALDESVTDIIAAVDGDPLVDYVYP